MYREFFSRSPLLALPVLSLVIFIAVFALIIVRTYGRKRLPVFEQASQLPLLDDEQGAPAVALARKESRDHVG